MTDQLEQSHQAFRNVTDTCRAPATRDAYTKSLRLFLKYLRLEENAYDKLLDKDPKLIQMDICDYIKYMRARGLASASVSTYLCGLVKFYAMNDITLNWHKIHSFEGEAEKQREDRPYTHSEIKLLIEHAGLRNRSIILLLCSSGARVGAIPIMRVKDLEPIDSHKIYKVTYYPKSKKFRYYSFCTPEARSVIDSYLDWRRRQGERLTEESPLFRKEFNGKAAHGIIEPMSYETIRYYMKRLLENTGLRGPTKEGPRQLYPVMENHGLRKFFETNAFRAGMNEEYIRRLMGHKGGKNKLSDTYNKIQEEELLNGDSKHVGYLGIIDQLTINEEHRLKREVKTLKSQNTELLNFQRQLDELRALIKQ